VSEAAQSEVAGAVLDGVLRKREYAGFFDTPAREGAALLAAGGDAAGAILVFFAVDPLEEDIEQEVTAKNANRQKYSKRHGGLTRGGVNG
jgi:hypothetical protein